MGVDSLVATTENSPTEIRDRTVKC